MAYITTKYKTKELKGHHLILTEKNDRLNSKNNSTKEKESIGLIMFQLQGNALSAYHEWASCAHPSLLEQRGTG